MKKLLCEFADDLQGKFSAVTAGEPENQLRGPIEQFLQKCGESLDIKVTLIGETPLKSGPGSGPKSGTAKPDFGVECQGLLCGYLELKAPGKGANTAHYKGHDLRQWKHFSLLPNILYSDGREFALYREGEMTRHVRFDGLPDEQGKKAISADNAKKLAALLRDFLHWEPLVPETAKQLAQYLAPLCGMLRDDVVDALDNGSEPVKNVARDWRKYLFPGASDLEFADNYAQTVTFSLLLARSLGSETLDLYKAEKTLAKESLLLCRALEILTEQSVKNELNTSLSMLQRVINQVSADTMDGEHRDPWLHFYEDFLEKYDPKLRKQHGVYYTPVEVVQAQVRLVDDLLKRKFDKPLGLAEGGVVVLDPAVGTGTYLLGIAEHTMGEVGRIEGTAAQPARASLLAANLYGFEIMVTPYAMATLRLSRMLRQYGGKPPVHGTQIMLHNTLEAPNEKIPELPQFYQPLGLEHIRAKELKNKIPILVIMGNPPYHRHDMATKENRTQTGGWIRFGETGTGKDAILNDFTEPVKQAGKGGSLKNIYNHYVYFWRWALWKVFELPHYVQGVETIIGPGVVTYITASSFLEGDAFMGMRQHMRKTCDEIWVLDLGGEGRGPRKDDNVFNIQTPVAITIAVRYGDPQPDKPAAVHYLQVEGTRAQKLGMLENCSSLKNLPFQTCPKDWTAPFAPERDDDYFDWPLLTDLMPWQWSGVQLKRKWPIAPDKDTLKKRWKHFLGSKDRASLFKETEARKVSRAIHSMDGTVKLTPLAELKPNTKAPKIEPYGYRSFDRQHLFVDNRLGDRLRKPLWDAYSDRQVYISTLTSSALGKGQTLAVSAHVPDLHFYYGSFGAKNIFPLYRDKGAAHPNLHPALSGMLREHYGKAVSEEDVAAYLYAVMAHPGYTTRFEEELSSQQLRVPFTADFDLFREAVKTGRKLLFLHTFGERFAKGQKWPQGKIKCKKPVSEAPLPKDFSYKESNKILSVGDGEFGPVPLAVYEYEVSGLKVVQSWLGNRTGGSKGKKSSPLDDIQPERWTAEYTSELLRLLNLLDSTLNQQQRQAELLDRILNSRLLSADELGPVPDETRKPLEQNGYQNGLWS